VRHFFFDNWNGIVDSFPGLFDSGSGEAEPDDWDDDPNSYEEAKIQAFQKNWGLYHQIVKLADDDILRVQQIFELPIVSVLNHISYLISRK